MPTLRAIVLAAGFGSRLGGVPKPLAEVAGIPLIVRVLRTLSRARIDEAVVVTGFEAEWIRRALASQHVGLSVQFAHNPRFELQNGVSVLAARETAPDGGLLVMADHLVALELVARVRDFPASPTSAVLGIDCDIASCFDLGDATKVRVDGSRVTHVSKALAPFDALDTGVFRIGSTLYDAVARLVARHGDASLSEAASELATRGQLAAADVSGLFWLDVDTRAALARAERLFQPPENGAVATSQNEA